MSKERGEEASTVFVDSVHLRLPIEVKLLLIWGLSALLTNDLRQWRASLAARIIKMFISNLVMV